MSDPQQHPDEALPCHRCGATTFRLYGDGAVNCSECGVRRTTLAPPLVLPPGRLRAAGDLGFAGSPNPLITYPGGTWLFTFGLDHPLHGRYVVIRGAEEDARREMTAIFGQGNWAGIYPGNESYRATRGRTELVLES
jgi:hypothetical protein